MTANLPPISVDGVARRNVDDALAAASDTDQRVSELTGQVTELARREAANGGLATTTTWVELGEATRQNTPVDIVNLPAGTSVQIVVDVLSGFPGDSVLQIAVAGQALPMSVWQETPLDPTTPGRYATPPIDTGAAFVLTRRGIITATLVAPGATSGMARVTVNHPPARRPDDGTLNVQDWGVLPTNGAADNTAALLALREWCRARPDTMHHILFPPSDQPYKYLRNDWTFGIRRFRLSGYGAKLMNDNGGFPNVGSLAYTYYTNGGMFFNVEEAIAGNPAPGIMGTLIDTVNAGETVVTLKEADTDLAPGKNVLIYGVQQQGGGYPPNPHYFEYNKIQSIDGIEVTLVNAVKQDYRDDWPEITDSSSSLLHGRARILSLNRADYNVAEQVIIEGIEFVRRTTNFSAYSKDQGFLHVGDALSCVVRDCKCEHLVVSASDEVLVQRTYVENYHEPDKILNKVRYEDCSVPYIQHATGTNTYQMDRCHIRNRQDDGGKRYSYTYARSNIFRHCTFDGDESYQIDFGLGGYAHGAIVLENNIFNKPKTNAPVQYDAQNYVQQLTPLSIEDDGTKTLSFTFNDKPDAAVSRKVYDGMPFFAIKNPPEESFISGYITGVRAGRTYTLATQEVVVDVETDGLALADSKVFFPAARSVDIKNNTILLSDTNQKADVEDFYFNANNKINRFTWITKFTGGIVPFSRPVFGICTEVSINVLRPYTGPGTSTQARFILRRNGYAENWFVDTTQIANSTKTVLDGSLPYVPVNEARFETTGFSYNAGTVDLASPIIEITIKVLSPAV